MSLHNLNVIDACAILLHLWVMDFRLKIWSYSSPSQGILLGPVVTLFFRTRCDTLVERFHLDSFIHPFI